jgi:chromate transporter
MMDGLALGETTPGPLIMVVAFVGFVGAYAQALLGPEHLFWAGALAASVVTWFTFLPSFVFIFAGAPFIETTHNDLKFTAPLSAITAAVVGVILNLAVFFAYHLFWPQGWAQPLSWPPVVLAVIAAWILFGFKRSVMEVIMVSGALGVLYTLMMP